MIKHFFKLIWNKKRTNFMTSLGIFVSFIVLFLVLVAVIYNISNYLKPLGFSYKDVWYITMDWKDSSQEEIKETLLQFENAFRSFPEIENFAYSESFIFTPAVMNMTNYEYNGREIRCNIRYASDDFTKVMGVEILEGRWFNESDNASSKNPLVINKYAKEEIFGNDIALGKVLHRDETEYIIIGVIDEFRNAGQFSGSSSISFRRISLNLEHELSRFGSEAMGSRILLKMKPGTPFQFEETLTKSLSNIAKDWQIKMNTLELLKKSATLQTLIFPVILIVVCGFLVINVALGLFGVIWYNTNRRKSEIGLRRALGSSAMKIYKQIIGEALVLSTFAMIFGSFFALQFPLLGIFSFIDTKIYIFAYVSAIILIYVITALCALYPSKIASNLEPAEALHYE
ncbi:MAG: ABC transporter permease [Armatimonadetes bacterium]|nr:ABC transporter permease [Armatimonadota bacterium]